MKTVKEFIIKETTGLPEEDAIEVPVSVEVSGKESTVGWGLDGGMGEAMGLFFLGISGLGMFDLLFLS